MLIKIYWCAYCESVLLRSDGANKPTDDLVDCPVCKNVEYGYTPAMEEVLYGEGTGVSFDEYEMCLARVADWLRIAGLRFSEAAHA